MNQIQRAFNGLGQLITEWQSHSGAVNTTDHFQYGYDHDGNRLYRDNPVNTAFGELYTYDELNVPSRILVAVVAEFWL